MSSSLATTATALERLPVELIVEIMKTADSPQDLYSLIKASPVCLRVFLQAPEHILSSLLRRIIPDDTRLYFLAALYIDSCPGTPETWINEQAPGFPEQYFRSAPFPFPTERAHIYGLARIYTQLEYFMDRYLREVSSHVYGTYNPFALSPSERHRLERAFLRYELYCRAFPVEHAAAGRDITVNNKFELYFGGLPPWEVEEVYCIHHFFALFAKKEIQELRNDFCVAVSRAPGVVRGDLSLNSQDFVRVTNLQPGALRFYSKEWNFRSRHSSISIVLRGFTFLYEFMRASKPRRQEMVRATYALLVGFPTEMPRDYRPPEEMAESLENVLDGDLAEGNVGFYQFRRTDEVLYEQVLEQGMIQSFLRELGYTFWDNGRLLDRDMNAKLQDGKHAAWEEVEFRFGCSYLETVEDRLRDVWVPRVEWARLEDEFGSAPAP